MGERKEGWKIGAALDIYVQKRGGKRQLRGWAKMDITVAKVTGSEARERS